MKAAPNKRTNAILERCRKVMAQKGLSPERVRDELVRSNYLTLDEVPSLTVMYRYLNGDVQPRAEVILALQEWVNHQ